MHIEFNLRRALIMAFVFVVVGIGVIVFMTPPIEPYVVPTWQIPALPTFTFSSPTYPPHAIATLTALGYNLTHTANAQREGTLGATLTASPTLLASPTRTASHTLDATQITIPPSLLTATGIIRGATLTQSALQTQFISPVPESVQMTLTQAIQNATQGTLSLVITPEATPTPTAP